MSDRLAFWALDLVPEALLGLGAGDALSALTGFVAAVILVSGVDDLFIDLCHYAELVRGALRPGPRAQRVPEAELRALAEKPIAVMIPAWREHAVIGRMLRHTLRAVDYRDYGLFVGVYPNDEPTMRAVAEAQAQDARVHRVVLPHAGPTSKADCLNWILEGIRRHDRRAGRGHEILVLHDCEDVVHPLSFRLMNRFIPGAAMVQLPVVPFEAAARQLTAGIYLGEFAEAHLKDLPVRERLSGMVPSAGVGTGFSRAIIETLARLHGGRPFNVRTFTEDYDLAFRIRAAGGRSIFLRYRTERGLVATRSYFPARFRDAVRQKARWTLGIVFHAWRQRGWEGGLALRYMLWRDRKALLTGPVNMLGYLLLLQSALGALPCAAPEGWVRDLLLVDAALLGNRCLQRALAVARVSSWRQGALALPRIVWGNIIDFCALVQAARLFLVETLTGRMPAWAKTAHAFPSEEALARHRGVQMNSPRRHGPGPGRARILAAMNRGVRP